MEVLIWVEFKLDIFKILEYQLKYYFKIRLITTKVLYTDFFLSFLAFSMEKNFFESWWINFFLKKYEWWRITTHKNEQEMEIISSHALTYFPTFHTNQVFSFFILLSNGALVLIYLQHISSADQSVYGLAFSNLFSSLKHWGDILETKQRR